MKKLRNNKIRKLLAFMVALALMVSCMPSAYTISASEAFGDGTEDIFTDGEITSEPAAEESTPDVSSADQEETEQAQQSTLTYENDSVKVTAEALEDGALPQNTALKADSVNENSSVSYDTVSQKLSAAATDKGSSLRGFFAYDVYFADGDGNRVEPNGRVRVTFEYKTPAAPELTDAASTSVTVEKLHYNSSTGDTDVNTLQANEDLKVLNVNEGKQIQTLQVETGNAAVFAVMWDSPETADVEAETVSGNEDGVSIASEELTDGMDISDEPEQDAAETPAAENPEVTPEAEPSEAPAENPDAEPTEAPAEDPDVVEEPAEDIASPEDAPAADENGETSLIEVLGDDTNLRVSPSIEAEVLATVNAGTQLTLLDIVTAEDGATWYKVSWEGTEAYIRSDMAQVVDSSDEAEEVEDVLESEEVSYSQEVGNVVVTATAASGVLPKDAQFVVNPIEKDSNQYADVADRLEKKAENEEYSIAGFLAYDIYFQDSEGNKINPEDGKVKVSMEYQNATAPEEVKEADAATMAMASADENSQDDTETAEQNLSVSVMHFVEDENGNVESVVDMTKDDTANVETNAEGEVQKAEFETESFSAFAIAWTYVQSKDNSTGSITIKDDIMKDGNLKPEMNAALTAKVKSAESVTYKWLKNVNNSGYTEVQKSKSGDLYNLSDDGSKLNVALDGGFLKSESPAQTSVKYKLKLEIQNVDGTTEQYESNEFNNPYWNELENGSFETPSLESADGNNQQYTNEEYKAGNGVWQSTASIVNKNGTQIEIVNGRKYLDSYSWYYPNGYNENEENESSAAAGWQFAELNCESTGALYQDVMTISGENMSYWLSHRARGNYANSRSECDTMYLVIMPTSVAMTAGTGKKELKTQEQLKKYLSNKGINIDMSYSRKGNALMYKEDSDGVLVLRVTSDDQNWNTIKETAGYVAKSYLTRFFFVAGKTASGYNTVGNFLDNVGFSQKLPPANPGQYSIAVKKSFSGLSEAQIDTLKDKLTFTIRVYNEDGSEVNDNKEVSLKDTTFTLRDMEYNSSTKTYSKTFTDQTLKMPTKKYIFKVVETNSQVNGYAVNTTQTVSGGSVQPDGKTTIITEEDSAVFSINNAYTNGIVQSKTAKLSTESDSWDNRVYDITLNASSIASTTEEADAIDVMLVLDQSGSMDFRSGLNYYKTCKAEKLDDTNQTYYWISDDFAATVYRTKYIDDEWKYRDDSKESGSWNTFDDDKKYVFYTAVADADGNIYTRNHYLKKAATEFVTSLASISPDSRIGLVTFNKTATAQFEGELKKVGNNLNSITSTINDLSTSGGTRQDLALNKANLILQNDNGTHRKYVILFTDGCPNAKELPLKTVRGNMGTEATNIKKTIVSKNGDSKLITVSVGLEGNENEYIVAAETLLKSMATTEMDSYNVTNADALTGVFKNILSSITTYYDAEHAVVKDYIDSRFEVIKDSVKSAGGEIGTDGGGTYVIWQNQTITPATNGNPGWTRTIKVKAKDSFIGGNNITTNGAGSGITVGGVTREFNQPTVNVKVKMEVNNKKVTIYKGDNTPVEEQILNQLFDNGNRETSYNQAKVDASKVVVKWYRDEACTEEITDMNALEEKPQTTTSYYIKVTYNAGKPTTESNQNTTKGETTYIAGTASGGTYIESAINMADENKPENEQRKYGVYEVNVISGQIDIIKNVKEKSSVDREFQFNVKTEDGDDAFKGEGKTFTLKVSKDSLTGKLTEDDKKTLSNLSRGTYVVSEVNVPDGYKIAGTDIADETNCQNSVENNETTFVLGNSKQTPNSNVISSDYTYDQNDGGVLGKVSYTNEYSVNLDLKKVDSKNDTKTLTGAKFRLEIKRVGENSTSSWDRVGSYDSFTVDNSESGIELTNLKTGIYRLTEIEAPNGYALLGTSIYFEVKEGTVTLVDDSGATIDSPSMWNLDNSKKILTIKNTEIYELPSSGGPGTYGFTISGVAILATALLLFINNKRREEEAKRS